MVSTDLTGAGVLILVLCAAIVAAAAYGMRRAAPLSIKSFSGFVLRRKRVCATAIAALSLGAMSGLGTRDERARACSDKLALAREIRASGQLDTSSFADAIDACEKSGDLSGRDAAVHERESLVAEISRKELEQRDAKFKAALAAAHAAAISGNTAAAVTAYEQASGLKPLDLSSSREFATQLQKHGAESVAAKDFTTAVKELEEAQHRDPSLPGIVDMIASANKQKHHADIAAVIASANDTVKNLCTSPPDLLQAWKSIQVVPKDDDQYPSAIRAASGLEKCRRSAMQQIKQALNELAIDQRKTIAKKLENSMLEQGADVHVYLGGDQKDRLTISYVLFNRAWAYKLTDGGSTANGSLLSNMQGIGFRRVTFSDGYDESYSFDLAPTTVDEAVASNELSTPFKLDAR